MASTPSKYYRDYNRRVLKVDEFNALREEKTREMCDLKKENYQLKNKLNAFMDSVGERYVAVYENGLYTAKHLGSGYNSETLQASMRVNEETKRQLLGNETFLRHFIGHNVEMAVRDFINGRCDDRY
jgi:hypothetical protein